MEKLLGGADGSGVIVVIVVVVVVVVVGGGGGDRLCSSFNNTVSFQGVIKCEMWEATLILCHKSDIIWEK